VKFLSFFFPEKFYRGFISETFLRLSNTLQIPLYKLEGKKSSILFKESFEVREQVHGILLCVASRDAI